MPDWVEELENGVYEDNKEFSFIDKQLISRDSLNVYKRQLFPDMVVGQHSKLYTETLYENDGVKLWQIDEYNDFAILSFKSKMCAIGAMSLIVYLNQ